LGLTYTTPTALDFIHRFKKYLLSKSTTHFSEKSNCLQESAKNFCSEILLSSHNKKSRPADQNGVDAVPEAGVAGPDFEEAETASSPVHEQDECDLGGGPHCLSAEIFSDLVQQSGQDEEPESVSANSELEIPDFSLDDVHHLSTEMRNAVNSLGEKNGIMTMAVFLARKVE
jgi:hypothetical protein